MARVTLQTIADTLGVSRTTVSNAYSRPDQLTEELRRRILDTAAELGYAGPNAAARTLRSGHAGAVGLLFTENLSYAFTDPYAVGFLQGVSEAAEAAATGLLLIPLPPGRDPGDTTRTTIATVRDAVVDAFCLYGLDEDHPTIDVVLQRGLPLVLVDEPRRAGLPFVGIDERAAGHAVAAHLLELGHRCIGVVVTRLRSDGREDWVDAARLERATLRGSRERLRGILDACADAGISREEVRVYEAAPHARESGRRAGGRILDTDPRPTAIAALSDQMALGVVDAATERGLQVPGDLSVTGFDDIPVAGRARLTTIRQPMVGKGRRAGQLLLAPDRGAAEQTVLLPHTLVVRGTTGRPPRTRRAASGGT